MAQTIRCPKCKHIQQKQPVCSNCGFDIRAYALSLKKKREDAANNIICPRCKTNQPRQPVCFNCGFEMIDTSSESQSNLHAGLSDHGNELLLSLSDLLTKTWEIFKYRWGTILVLYILSIFLMGVPVFLFGSIGAVLTPMFGHMGGFVAFGSGVVALTFGLFGMGWGMASVTAGVVDHTLTVRESLDLGWRLLLPYLWIISLVWFIVAGGFFLFFIPGFILMIWLFPAQFIIFDEKERGMTAILKAREYVRGYSLDTFLKLLVIWLGTVVASFIPFVGQFIFFPFMMIYIYQMYLNLRDIKGYGVTYSSSFIRKTGWLGVSTLGWAVPFVLIAVLALPALKSTMPELVQGLEQGTLDMTSIVEQLNQEAFIGKGKSSQALVSTTKKTYTPGEPVTVRYAGLPGNRQDWINVVRSSAPDSTEGDWFFTEGKKEGTHEFAGLKPGIYEVRLFFNWPEGGSIVQERYRFTVRAAGEDNPPVTEGTAVISIDKLSYAPGERVYVTFLAPLYDSGWIGIVPSHIKHGSEELNDEHDYTRLPLGGKTTGNLAFTAPEQPGSYDIRMHDSDNEGAEVASVSFTVRKKIPIRK